MKPLASIIRPQKLDDFIGQDHLVGPGKPLSLAIDKKILFSFILWGPSGSGKTTLAKIYSSSFDSKFYELSAVSSGKKDIQKIISDTKDKNKIIFLDEIHRFNKSQQDFLLPFIETGEIILIGATTENPSFEIISPLLSRCHVFILNSLSSDELKKIIKKTKINLGEEEIDWLVNISNGDARQLISILENTLNLYDQINLNNLKKVFQSRIRYDKKGDNHYNLISAFIKSMRAGQVNASIYYLSRMIKAGEDPKFIARRMIVFASEDIGMAQPTALVVANEVFRSVEIVGLPECSINLAHGTVYLSQCKKSRHAYEAYKEAEKDLEFYGNLPVPLKICNPSTKLMDDLGYGKDYEKYSTDDFLPDKLKGKKYYKK